MFIMLLMQAKEDEFMNKEMKVVCYIRTATFEQIESREQRTEIKSLCKEKQL